MKDIFRKIARVKKRQAIKRAIAASVAAYVLKYRIINQTTDLFIHSSQEIKSTNNQKTYTVADDDDQSLIESKSVNSTRVKTGSGAVIEIQKHQTPEALKSALGIRNGDLGKSGPGPRAKADARKNFNSGSSMIPGAAGFVPQNTYCRFHENAPLSCKPRVKISDDQFKGYGYNNQPPPEDGSKFDASQYKGGYNPLSDKFDYDNPNHTRENNDFSSQKRMNHAYDRQAEKCFGMKENRNKENLKKFEGKARSFIESPETEKINGSYRYETPAYFYKEKDGNLVAIVNATESQLNSIRDENHFGLDTHPSMQLTLRLRGPKNQN